MYSIVSDTSANIDVNVLKERDIRIIPFTYYLNGRECTCTDTTAFDGGSFYEAMRGGTKVTTSQITPQKYIDCFRPILEKGRDILFVSMSSGISGSYSSAMMAAAELKEEFPDRVISLIDTIGASLGEGLLALRAADLRDAGVTIEKAAEKLKDLRHKMCNIFTVDDLKYLRNTGRLSRTSTTVGTVLNIKPLLKGDGEGKIVCFQRSRGRKKAIAEIAAYYDRYVRDAGSQTVGIAHADCEEDAKCLAELIKRNNPPKDIMTVMYEPVTGSHVGPGALAFFFTGDEKFRDDN
ncbi:MAG: DegV family protein [Oscillospiraceae bacterium]|nr:DegV family protein [Oscillospiraceae bacterium]